MRRRGYSGFVVLLSLLWWRTAFGFVDSRRLHMPSSGAPDVTLSLNIIVNNRPSALRRLLDSIEANQFSKNVTITFNLEARQDRAVHKIVDEFIWSGGQVFKRARISKGGLISAVVEAWSPMTSSQDEYSLFLEDDIVLAPSAKDYLYAMLPFCSIDTTCAGVSLYTPRVNELDYARPKRLEILGQLPQLYGQQLPCSWGAAYKSYHWGMFRYWMESRMAKKYASYRTPPALLMGLMDGWANSWKKFFGEITLFQGWYVMYPNYANQTSFSTNMLEVGEHIKKIDDRHKADDYTVPLMEKFTPIDARKLDIVLLDPMDTVMPLISGKNASKFNIDSPYDGLISMKEKVCTRYNPELHKELFNFIKKPQTTMVVSHFAQKKKMKNERGWIYDYLQYYCKMDILSRIIVVWQNPKEPLPRKMMCDDGMKQVFFIRGDGKDRLINRFYPTELIPTPSVLTIDDDILIDEVDVSNMVKVWAANKKFLVGPFSRYYTKQNKYTYNSDDAKFTDGYSILLTKAHVSPVSLFYHTTCSQKYRRHRRLVDRVNNCEDLLYLKVANDIASIDKLPIVKYRTKCPIGDVGGEGLHNKKNHMKERTWSLRMFELLDDSKWQKVEYSHEDTDNPVEYVATKEDMVVSMTEWPAEAKAKEAFTKLGFEKMDAECYTG